MSAILLLSAWVVVIRTGFSAFSEEQAVRR